MNDNTQALAEGRICNIFNVFLWLALLILGVSSCSDDIGIPSGWGETCDGEEVTLPLELSIAPMKALDSETRAWTYYEATDEEKTIADIWFIQYNNEGVRVGLPRYFDGEDVKNTIADGRVESIFKDLKILVPREEDHDYTCVVLANTHNGNLFNADNRSKFSTLDSLRNFDLIIHNQEDLFHPHPVDNDTHEMKYLLMSGWTKINKDTENVKVDLIRNTCKINVKLTNFDDQDLIFKYYQWVDVPMGKLFPHGTTSHYKESVSLDFRQHNEEDRFESLCTEDGLTFWLPCNVWLPEDDLLDGSDKTPSTASDTDDVDREEEPTHFDIVCRKADESDMDLYEFRIYPSRDAEKQFNFEPNHFYQIEVDINGMPAEENAFFRRTEFKNLGISNSFLLRQDTKGIYAIPTERINVFWDYFDPGMMLYDDSEWVAEEIWQDSDQRIIDFAINGSGEIDQERSRHFGVGKTPFAFRTTGTGRGNVIVGVRMKYDGEEEYSRAELDEIYPIEEREYLWSWHLWITDYDPDKAADFNTKVVDGAFYQVPGGQVIQMGINVMMDRNLGAWAPEVTDPTDPMSIINTFGLYYQYGRKDPFPYFNPDRKPIYDIDGHLIPAFNTQEVSFWLTKRVAIVDEEGRNVKDEGGNSIYEYPEEYRTEKITMVSSAADGMCGSFALGVLQPYKFWADVYFTHHWASDAGDVKMDGGWYLTQWYLEYLMDLAKEDPTKFVMKDIFDPCPAGWVMDSSSGDFYEGASNPVGAAIELFYGQQEYLLWKGFINAGEDSDQSVKFEDTEENRAKKEEYLKLENEFWEDLNDESASISGSPSPFMGAYLYYAVKPGTSYFPAAGSRNRYGAGDRFHNYMCLPWGNIMMRLTSFGWNLIQDSDKQQEFYDEEFSSATAMQVRCVRL